MRKGIRLSPDQRQRLYNGRACPTTERLLRAFMDRMPAGRQWSENRSIYFDFPNGLLEMLRDY